MAKHKLTLVWRDIGTT